MYVYVSTVMKYAFADILVSWYPGFYVPPPPPRTPEKIKINLHILDFNPKGSYQIFSIFDM